MALTGTVKVPGIGAVPKKGAVYGTVAIVVIGGGIYVYRKRHAPAAGTGTTAGAAGTVTDPAGNTCPALNPATGFCPGTAEDAAASQSGGYNASQLGGGLAGYYYGPGGAIQPAPPGPGNFADNAEWSQYAINFMVQTLNAKPGPLGEALGKYLAGQGVDQDQHKLIEEAIAIAGQPPQAGTGGFPPRIRLEAGHRKPGKVKVPDVRGKPWATAREALTDAGLKAKAVPHSAGIVATQAPKAGTDASRGTIVTLHMRQGVFGPVGEGK